MGLLGTERLYVCAKAAVVQTLIAFPDLIEGCHEGH